MERGGQRDARRAPLLGAFGLRVARVADPPRPGAAGSPVPSRTPPGRPRRSRRAARRGRPPGRGSRCRRRGRPACRPPPGPPVRAPWPPGQDGGEQLHGEPEPEPLEGAGRRGAAEPAQPGLAPVVGGRVPHRAPGVVGEPALGRLAPVPSRGADPPGGDDGGAHVEDERPPLDRRGRHAQRIGAEQGRRAERRTGDALAAAVGGHHADHAPVGGPPRVDARAAEVGGAPHRHEPDAVAVRALRRQVHRLRRGPQTERPAVVQEHTGPQVAQDLRLGGGIGAAGLQERPVEPAQVEHAVRVHAGQVAVAERLGGEPGPGLRDPEPDEAGGGLAEQRLVRDGHLPPYVAPGRGAIGQRGRHAVPAFSVRSVGTRAGTGTA